MHRRALALPFGCLLLLVACKKDGTGDAGKAADAETKDDGKEDGKAETKDDGKADTKDDGKADTKDDGKSAAGGEIPTPAGAVTDCPESLSGKETISRVITKACGVVPVTGDYKIEGGTLQLEPGAKLEFKEGTGLQVGYYETSKLIVNGTEAEPVVFSTSGDKVPGVWRGIQLYGKAARSSIKHAVIEYAGDKKAALHVEAADVEVEHVTIKEAKDQAVEVRGEGSFASFTGNKLEKVAKIAMKVSAPAAATIGEGNTFAPDAEVQIDRGKISQDAKWADIGAPWLVAARIDVEGEEGRSARLEIAPGNELRFDGDGHLQVGYYAEGVLHAVGEPGKEIVFGAHDRTERGSWRGLAIYGKGEAKIEHAVFRHGGKKDKEGALLVADSGRIDLSNATFEDDAVSIVLKGDKVDVQKLDALTFKNTPVALDLNASKLGSVGAGNTYEGEPAIVVNAAKIEADTTWHKHTGAKVQIEGKVQVTGARLTIEPGSELQVKDGVGFEVGYYDIAGLELSGTADAPIRIVGMRDVPGSWKGIVLFTKAKDNKLSHVVLRNAGGSKAAVEVKGEADAKIDTLTCEKCTVAAVTWECKSKVETNAVEAKEDTPVAEAAPTNCK